MTDLKKENDYGDRRDRPHLHWSMTENERKKPMNPKRIPKRYYNGSNTESPKTKHPPDKPEIDDTLKILEKKIDAGAAHIGLVIADIFTFLTKSAAMLPDMELHTELLDLNVDDSGISVYIKHPDNRSKSDNDYDDEEELLYDGD